MPTDSARVAVVEKAVMRGLNVLNLVRISYCVLIEMLILTLYKAITPIVH